MKKHSFHSLHLLFNKLGGKESILSIMVDFYQRLSKDILIGFFFIEKDLALLAHRQTEFLLFLTGDLTPYTGRLPFHAHQHLPPILPGHFQRRLLLLKETLHDYGLSSQEAEIWMESEKRFFHAIVKKKKEKK